MRPLKSTREERPRLTGWIRRHPKALLPVAVVAFGALSAYVLISARSEVVVAPPQVPPPLVRAMHVEIRNVQLTVNAQGTVAPRTKTSLVSQVAGQIISVSPAFANGGFFKAGDVLLAIDPRDYELAVDRAKAVVAQARVRLAREEEEAELARQEWQRLGNGEATDLALRKPQLEDARAALQAARASQEQARLALDRTRIRAPYEGRVLSKIVDLGQYVNPGAHVARIYAVDYAEIRLPVPHEQLAYLDLVYNARSELEPASRPKALVHAVFAGAPHTWEGEIVRIEGEIDARTRMVNLVARVDAPYNQDDDPARAPLFAGLFVEVEILGRVARDVAVVPRTALRGAGQVLVVDEDSRLRFRGVDLLRLEAENALIRSGLDGGERVCISTLDAVVEGMQVRILGPEDEAASRSDGGAG
ncbi:MAG: efflux RND transporter periplasmic adaptor subunit [Gemmatimonadota bacterium]|nr:efflux RND transporter periplasmic adaptor subunit [Gemmatimonadota bacterium]